jgi:hypothetical protein
MIVLMKPKPEYVEGPEAWKRFEGAMRKALAVPHSEIQRRLEAERQRAAQNPRKRGPKPKVSSRKPTSASDDTPESRPRA